MLRSSLSPRRSTSSGRMRELAGRKQCDGPCYTLSPPTNAQPTQPTGHPLSLWARETINQPEKFECPLVGDFVAKVDRGQSELRCIVCTIDFRSCQRLAPGIAILTMASRRSYLRRHLSVDIPKHPPGLLQHGVIPGSSHPWAWESALQEE